MADLHSSQDNYAYEAEQERLAEMKVLHQPMKKWYAGQARAEPKWGAFPLFWQDLGTWAPYREVCVGDLYMVTHQQYSLAHVWCGDALFARFCHCVAFSMLTLVLLFAL
jgi:hypothetical protein